MKIVRVIIACMFVALVMSCGGEKKEGVKIGSAKTEKTKDNAKINLAISGNDFMQFDKKEFNVKTGQKVTLTLRHTGKLGMKIMGHNFVLLKEGTSIPTFSASAASAGQKSDWIPDGGKEVIAHTKMIGGGETATVTFTTPASGTYDFICSFPGHSGLMKGKFIVE